MQKIKDLQKIVFGVSLFFIFLVFLNFRDIPNRYTLVCAGCFYLFYAVVNKKLYLNISTVLLGVCLFLYAKIRGFDTTTTIMHAALPAMMQILGKSLMEGGVPEKGERWLVLLPAAVFLLGYSGHGILNGIVFFVEGTIKEGVRYWADAWNGNILPGTQHSIYLLPALAIMFPAVVYLKQYRIAGALTLLTGVFFLYYSFESLSRIPIMVFGILAIWEFILFLAFNRDNEKLMKYTRRGVYVLLCLGAVGAVLLLMNWEAVLQIPFVRNLSKDGGILNNVRFRAQRSVLTQLFAYPKGGMPIEGIQMAHNVWLDMAKDTGLVTFVLFTVYTACTLIQVLKLLIGKSCNELKYVLSGVYFALFLYYTVEPALNANIQYMIPWTFVNGLIYGSNKRMKAMENKKESVLTKRQQMYLPMKRAIDVVLSGGAIIVFSPVLLGIAIAIKIDSPGPVLFKQKRVGKDKEFFDIWKFRTMRTDTPKDMPTHLLRDPEQYITKTGKFLRKTSLDELPQLFQIFSGKMSICGPRPALWNQDDLIAERDKYGANGITPGLTGWAQINGRDELEIDVKAKLDGEYVEKFGLAMDIRCFLGTIISVAKSDGVVEGGTGELNRRK